MKHRLIDKLSNLDTNSKIFIFKNFYGIDHTDKLLNSIDDKLWFCDNSLLKYNFHSKYNMKFKDYDFIKNNADNVVVTYKHHNILQGLYFDPNENFAISFYTHDFYPEDNRFIIHTNSDTNTKLVAEFIDDNIEYSPKSNNKTLEMGLLVQHGDGGYGIKYHPVKPIIDLNIEDNYNDDFININAKLDSDLTFKSKSLNILHGLPGTGKTTYIKYLCYKLAKENKRVIYLSPNITSVLSSPQFISYLDLFKNAIVIIEDAESILINSNNRSQALTNILNITDGILSDIYNIHFIFTFNTDIKNIDEALLRKGRLNLKYEFKELSADKAEKLSKKLGVNLPNKHTLSEIYNIEDTGVQVKSTTKLGF